MQRVDDGQAFLAGPDVGDLLFAAIDHAGGELQDWVLEQIDAVPGQSTTATYLARVVWPYGERKELIGVSARAGGVTGADERANIFGDGDREVAVWVYPNDPDLPGLSRAAYPQGMAELLTESRLLGGPVESSEISLRMIGYRPRRRAVLKVSVANHEPAHYVKIVRAGQFDDIVTRHELLTSAGIPAPRVVLTTPDHMMFTQEVAGRPLADAIFDPVAPLSAESLIDVLDAMPAAVADLERRPPWSDAVTHYARMIAAANPALAERVGVMAETISAGLSGIPLGTEPTHGDFHEGQVYVFAGQVCGLLDVDTIGPGRRADDLACALAHLLAFQHMSSEQTDRVRDVVRQWTPVFDRRVDPFELRLRTAAVLISLATGPYRSQEPDWELQTERMVASAEALVAQVT